MKRGVVVSVVSVVLLGACSSAPVEAPVVGPPVSGSHFSFDCSAHGVGVFDSTRTFFPGVQLPCTVRVADRSGAAVAGANVQVLSEAGRVIVPGPTAADGSLAVVHEVGLPLPVDVAPTTFSWTPVNDATHTGTLVAPAWMVPNEWMEAPHLQLTTPFVTFTLREPRRPDPIRLSPSGTRFENNPRDNLVAMIAVVDGEEGFTDLNSNGAWDDGEPFIDLTEPFVDTDDDGTRGETEPFVDTNGNGLWDGKNGAWDANTKPWVLERILWTGLPAFEDVQLQLPGVVGARPVISVTPRVLRLRCSNPECTPWASVNGEAQSRVSLYLADPWFNPVARSGAAGDWVVLDAETLPIVVTPSLGDFAGRIDWPAGEVMVFDVEDRRVRADAGLPRRAPELPFSVRMLRLTTTTPVGLDGGTLAVTFDLFSGSTE